MRACVTCSHIDRDEIERGIVSGVSLAEISRRYGISEDSLYHHRDNCLPNRLAQGEVGHDLFATDRILERILWLHQETVALYTRNKGVNDGLALKALARLATPSQTAIRVQEYVLKAEKAGGKGSVDIAAILAGARRRLGLAVGQDPDSNESPDEKTA
jgi:hypothetical protein